MGRHASTNKNLKAHAFKCYLEAERKVEMECVFIFSNLISKDALSSVKRQLFNLSKSLQSFHRLEIWCKNTRDLRQYFFLLNHHYNIISLFSFNAPTFSRIYRVLIQGGYFTNAFVSLMATMAVDSQTLSLNGR